MGERILYLDLVGGAAGDMLLAALIDAGAPIDSIRQAFSAVDLDHVGISTEEAHPAGLRARRVVLRVAGALLEDPGLAPGSGHGHRPYRLIRARIERSSLTPQVRALALETFALLARAEAEAHGVDPEEVEFHEVGADDAIADIVGVAQALTDLGIARVVVSPIPLGRGVGRGAHGPFPLPAPATVRILQGAPTTAFPLEGETVTPTGAALLMALADEFGPIPAMRLEHTGVGAGTRSWEDRPNVVRAILGEATASVATSRSGEMLLESSIDDMNPEHLDALREALFAAGAADVWMVSAQGKKGRIATIVQALVASELLQAALDAFFVHSTTLGVRAHPVERFCAHREIHQVETELGPVRVKVADRPSGSPLVKPEHEDCLTLARRHGISLREVYEAAQRAYWAQKER